MKRLIKKANENKKDISEIENIVKEWYRDGFYDRSLFHGTFHIMDDNLTLGNGGGFSFDIDFGSADKEEAIENLNERLKPLDLYCHEDMGIIHIVDIHHLYS